MYSVFMPSHLQSLSVLQISPSIHQQGICMDGGAIYGEQFAFAIADTNFTENEGYGGGAIAGTKSSLFNITSSNIVRNVGMQWGRTRSIKVNTGTSLLTLADINFFSQCNLQLKEEVSTMLDSLVDCSFMNCQREYC